MSFRPRKCSSTVASVADVSFQLPHNPDDFLRKPIVNEDGKGLFTDQGETPPPTPDTPFAAPQDTSGQPAYRPNYDTVVPHRGTIILVLGVLGIVGAVASVILALRGAYLSFTILDYSVVVAATNLGLTFTAAGRGRIDLRGMKLGAVDPTGRTMTLCGYWLGVVGTLVSLGVCLVFLQKIIAPLFTG